MGSSFLATDYTDKIHGSAFRYDRQLDEARVVNPLCCFLEVFGFGPEDVLHECLRVAIVKWEPARLDLHHDAVTREKDVIRRRQSETIFQRLISCDCFRKLQALAVTPAEHVSRNH